MPIRYFTALDGARLAYRDEGQGPALLALSGLTRNMEDFDYLAPHLQGVRLIRMDYRGRGASQYTGALSYTVVQEGADALTLLDHLGVERAAILGSSRGGLIAMLLAATARARLSGVCFNDVGPRLEPEGLARIAQYIGRTPKARSLEEVAQKLALNPGFANVPMTRWLQEAAHQVSIGPNGAVLRYDPALAEPFSQAFSGELPEAWPFFEALAGLPVCLIRGANSELLSAATAAKMSALRPDMIYAEIPDRGHIPFLDEPEALAAIKEFLSRIKAMEPPPRP